MRLACRCAVVFALTVAGAAAAAAPRSLRLVSYNALHGGLRVGGGDGERLEERLALASDGLRALAPDIVGLQEASAGSERGDVAARLADALGLAYHVRAAAGFRWIGRITRRLFGFEEGPAILSRFPIVSSAVIPLDACDGWYRRVLLCAVVGTPWGLVDVCSTHPDGSPCQLRSLARHLAARRMAAPLVVLGDLNAIPEAPGMNDLLRVAGLADTFRAANPAASGFTVWQAVRAPRAMVRRRVDYVLVAPAAGGLRVRQSRVVLATPGVASDGRPLWPSDHFGVLSRVDLF